MTSGTILARMGAHNGRSAALGSAPHTRATRVPAGAKDDPSTYPLGQRGSRHGLLSVDHLDDYSTPTDALSRRNVDGRFKGAISDYPCRPKRRTWSRTSNSSRAFLLC